MKSKEYIQSCLITEAKDMTPAKNRFSNSDNRLARLNHAALGVASEHVELREAIRKRDAVNMMEEAGDQLWYLAIAIDALGLNPDMITPKEKTEKQLNHDFMVKVLDFVVSFLMAVLVINSWQMILPQMLSDVFHDSQALQTVAALVVYMASVALLRVTLINPLVRAEMLAYYSNASCDAGSEFVDLVKKDLMYGRTIDVSKYETVIQNTIGALGHVCEIAGYTLEEAKERNSAKLMKRYSGGFTEKKAVNRDLESERKILEGKSVDAPKK